MSYLLLKHLTNRELPAEWAKYLSTEQTFTVMIVPETSASQSQLPAPVTEPNSCVNSYQGETSPRSGYNYLRCLKESFFDPS